MKIQCPCCSEVIEIDDVDIRAYVSSLRGKTTSEAKKEACRANASKPRPGAQGKPKPRKQKGE